MFYYICSFAIIVLEMISGLIFFDTFIGRDDEKDRYGKVLVVIGTSILGYAYAYFMQEHFILKEIAVIVTLVIAYKILYRENLKKILALTLLFQGLLLGMDYILYAIVYSAYKDMLNNANWHYTESMLIVLLSKFPLFICVIVIKRVFAKKRMDYLSDTEWIRFFFFPCFTVCVIVAMISATQYIDNQRIGDILYVIAIGLVGLNILVFYLIDDIVRRESRIHEQLMQQAKLQKEMEMYTSIADNYNRQRKRVHEFKNQMLCISTLLKRREYEEAAQYVGHINETMVSEINSVNANHVIINAVLNTKYQEAVNKNIVVMFKVNDLSGINMKDEDLVAIMSNLFNNAIEACEQCASERVIHFKAAIENGDLIIGVKNTYSHNLIIENNQYISTKSNQKEEHGVGIKNIIETVEKYKGEYAIRSENYQFFFSIIIPEIIS